MITAGPTWVPIDTVRVISNVSTGETGILLAKEAKKQGAKVTLLLGPVGDKTLDNSVRVIRFRTFSELKERLIKELHLRKYDVVIHSAAVSDYRTKRIFKSKIKSGLKVLRLELIPTSKIIDLIKRVDSSLFLAAFKFETQASKQKLIHESRLLLARTGSDLIVGNTILRNRYSAYLISKGEIQGPELSKEKMAWALINRIGELICKN